MMIDTKKTERFDIEETSTGYDSYRCMIAEKDGDYVRFESYDLLAAESKRLAEALRELLMREFVRRRNAALQPKPVDLRREKIIAALDKQYLNGESSKIADAVLAAIDEVK